MRADKYLSLHGFSSRTKAARAIAEGRVTVNGKCVSAADEVQDGDLIQIKEKEASFVSEGGFKLYKALREFNQKISGLVFADVGASTGGFTDCLLQNGARQVFAVDVGESQLDQSLLSDDRVTVMDRTNARYLKEEDFPCRLDGAVIDVSFISLKQILPAVSAILKNGGLVFALVKPQFECGARALDKHGIDKNAELRAEALLSVCEAAEQSGLYAKKISVAPIKAKKNIEYIVLFEKVPPSTLGAAHILEFCKENSK